MKKIRKKSVSSSHQSPHLASSPKGRGITTSFMGVLVTSLMVTSTASAGFFDSAFTSVTDVDNLVGDEYESGITRPTAESFNNILKSLKYLKANVGRLVSGTNPLDDNYIGRKLGIDNSAPSYKLDVNGTFRAVGNSVFDSAVKINSDTGGAVITGSSSFTDFLNTDTIWNQNPSLIISNTSRTNGSAASLTLAAKQTTGASTKAFSFLGSSAPYKLSILSGIVGSGVSNELFSILGDSGNVGIGTTTPTGKLHVSTPDQVSIFESQGGSNSTVNVKANTHELKLRVHSTTGAYLESNDYDISINPGGASNQLATFTTTGNVGIGTTTPTEKLDVSGNVKATAFIGDGSQLTGIAGGLLTKDNTNTRVELSEQSDGTARTAGTEFVVTDDGKVGIGTDSPLYKLSIEANTQWQLELKDSNTTDTTAGILFSGKNSSGSTDNASIGSIAGNLILSGTSNYATSPQVVLSNAGNLGIGTETPTEKLDVVGNVKATAFIGDGSQLTGIDTGVFDKNNTNTRVELSEQSDGTARTAGTEFVVTDDGKVGIGTDSPTSRLDIGGNGHLTLSGYGGTTLPFLTSLNKAIIEAPTGKSLAFLLSPDNSGADRFSFVTDPDNTGGPDTEALVIRGSGKVGIGTTAPTEKLDVDGNVKATAFIGDGSQLTGIAGGLLTKDNTNTRVELSEQSDGTARTAGTEFVVTDDGKVGIGTDSPTAKLDVNGVVRSTSTTGVPLNGVGIEMSYYTGAIKYGQIYTYDRDNSIYKDLILGSGGNQLMLKGTGNVGIGTTAPAEKLDVAGAVKATAFIGDGSQLTGIAGGLLTKDNTNTRVELSEQSDGTARTAGTEFVVTDDGKVGIGTDSPTGRLHIQDINTTFKTVDENGQYYLGVNASSTNTGSAALFINNQGSGDGLRVDVAGSPSSLIVRSNGNVGIGTTTPTEKLDVDGNVKATAFIGDGSQLTGISGSGLLVKDNTNTRVELSEQSDGTARTAGTEFVVTDSGKVGIGVTNPLGSLNILNGAYNEVYFSGTDVTNLRTDADFNIFSSKTGGILKFDGDGGNTSDLIVRNGNTGIGNIVPLEKLDVAGAVKIASTTSTCVSNKVGTIQYVPDVVDTNGDSTANGGDFHGCVKKDDGTFEWVSMTGIF